MNVRASALGLGANVLGLSTLNSLARQSQAGAAQPSTVFSNRADTSSASYYYYKYPEYNSQEATKS